MPIVLLVGVVGTRAVEHETKARTGRRGKCNPCVDLRGTSLSVLHNKRPRHIDPARTVAVQAGGRTVTQHKRTGTEGRQSKRVTRQNRSS